MGSGEVDKSAQEEKEEKEPKTPGSQEPSQAAIGAVADWSGFQAYSPVPPHGFMSSPQGHPYMWGVQQFIPPYGTPQHPYVAMYPHGGIYAHPTMTPGSYPFSPYAMPSPNGIAEASGNPKGNVEVDGKSEGKEKLPIKRSKGSLGSLNMITGKNNENNGVYKSAESESEGSSEGSDTNSHHESPGNSCGQQDSAEPSQNGGTKPPDLMVNQITGPTTNLNIGMDYWGGTPLSAVPPVQGGMVHTGSQDGVQPQIWRQDDRELKKQKRKQSNRESARRSRLRKQAECDELGQRAEALKEENASLRAEMAHIRSEYERLLAQNASLQERIDELPEQDDQ